MDGRSTDPIIDRIFWGLTNVCTREELDSMIAHFTNDKVNTRTKIIEKQIIAQLDAGKYYKAHNRSHDNALFPLHLMGDDLLLTKEETKLEELIITACQIVALKCDAKEAEIVANKMRQSYSHGHAGGEGLPTGPRTRSTASEVEEDRYGGGTASAGNGMYTSANYNLVC